MFVGALVTAAPDPWADAIRRVHDQAAGILHVVVIERDDVPGLLARAMLGDAEATRLAHVLTRALERIAGAPRRRPAMCACCPRPLKDGRFSIAVALPARDDATQGLALAVCRDCATGRVAVEAAATKALRCLWPAARPIRVHPGKGCA